MPSTSAGFVDLARLLGLNDEAAREMVEALHTEAGYAEGDAAQKLFAAEAEARAGVESGGSEALTDYGSWKDYEAAAERAREKYRGLRSGEDVQAASGGNLFDAAYSQGKVGDLAALGQADVEAQGQGAFKRWEAFLAGRRPKAGPVDAGEPEVLERPRGQLAHHVYTPARSTSPYGGPGGMGDDEGDVDKRRRRGTATSPYNDWQDWR